MTTTESGMRRIVADHIAAALASGDVDRWHAARELAHNLDEEGCNVDNLVNAKLRELGENPSDAWQFPQAPVTPVRVESSDAARAVIVGHIAEALVDGNGTTPRTWARGMTHELKRAGFDITDRVKARIIDMTLGPDTADDVPF